MRIDPARPSDLPALRWLLEYERLPASDLDESSLERFLAVRTGAARGYRIAARSEAPATIQATTQFSALCPSTAILMVKP